MLSAGSVKLLIMSQVRLTNYVSSTTYGVFSLTIASMGGFAKLARQVEGVRDEQGNDRQEVRFSSFLIW